MVCAMYCTISIIFIISMIYMMFSVDNNSLKQQFMKTLDDKTKTKYENIILERRNIYFQGYILGLVISMLIILLKLTNNVKMSKTMMVCIVLAVSFMTNYFYYILSPKSSYIITELQTKASREAWLKIYKTMQYNYHVGFVLGIVAVSVLPLALC